MKLCPLTLVESSIESSCYRLCIHEDAPGVGFDILTDMDQRSWVFLNDPKNTLPLTKKTKKTN